MSDHSNMVTEMRAVLYCRKSTVQEHGESVERQAELARAFAKARGWEIIETFVDDALSGADFTNRDGLARMLAAAQRKPRPFDVIVTMDDSRLGRDQFRTGYLLQQITDAGVQVWFYQEQRQAKLDDATGKLMESLRGFGSELEREKGRARTREALKHRAERGDVAGGVCFGYKNVRTDGRVRREIIPDQLQVVKRVFEEVAAGRGFSRVAKGLNQDGIPSPARGRGWASGGVRAIVLNDLYIGKIIWGRTRWIDRGGRKVKVRTPESDWIKKTDESIRIVSADLWQRAHASLDKRRADYKRTLKGRIVGRPKAGDEARDGKFLLTSLLECAVCHGSMCATTRTGRRQPQPVRYYVCGTHGARGNAICANAMSVHMFNLHAAVVDELKVKIFTADVVAEVVEETIKEWQKLKTSRTTERPSVEADIRKLEVELAKYADAIADAGPIPAVINAIKTRERRRADLHQRLIRLENAAGVSARVPSAGDVRDRIQQRLDNWWQLFERHPIDARQQVLKPLFGGRRLIMTPQVGRFYDFKIDLPWGAVVAGLVGAPTNEVMVVPPG
jgi:site-specific DNA recombinase